MPVVTHEQQKLVETQSKDIIGNFVPFVNVNELPSKFLPYPEGSEIKYRPYVFGEIKKFNQSKMSKKEELEFVLNGIQTSFEKSLLTLADLLFIGLLRKISTFGSSKSIITFRCPTCRVLNEFTIENNSIEFDDLDVSNLPIVLQLSDDSEYHFRPFTINNYFDLLNTNEELDTIAMLAKMCINHEYKECFDRFYNASGDESVDLELIDEYLYHGVTSVSGTCKECGTVTSLSLDGGAILIRPFRSNGESASSTIRFGT